ncbi:hypothetical protein P8452_75903 [Trifolium repens]|nr:hypothetical protein P8452_75903 [Trifolium repens]
MKACEISIEDYDWDDGASKLHRMFEEEETAKTSRRMLVTVGGADTELREKMDNAGSRLYQIKWPRNHQSPLNQLTIENSMMTM